MGMPSDVVIEDRHHSVGLHRDPRDYAASVCAFLVTGLRRGDGVLVLATTEHLRMLERELAAAGLDVAELEAAGRYTTLEARRVLDDVFIAGRVDPDRFAAVISRTVVDLAARRHPLRIFGELVGLLWQQGDVTAAMAVEEQWNELQTRVPFRLHCGYEVDGHGAERDLDQLRQLCTAHTGLTTACWAPGEELVDDTIADRYTHTFLPTLAAPCAVRRFVSHVVGRWDHAVPSDEIELVASELATNAVLHANSPFQVTVVLGDGRLTLRVRDTSPVPPTRRQPGIHSANGRGIGIVAELARAWGVDPVDGGKVVWVELDDRPVTA